MMPPVEMASCTPAEPFGAKPCTCMLALLKWVSSSTITSNGTMNLKMLTMLLAMAKLFTLK
ncbi:hypothetical protein D3C81_1091760 [compost metagenome]